jgi:hypothetical protein
MNMRLDQRPPIDQHGNIVFQAGYAYPLNDPERYDEDGVSGFRYALIDPDADPGECHTHDAWIVNENATVHPGYAQSPIPVRRQDLDMNAGFRMSTQHAPQPRIRSPLGSMFKIIEIR